MAYLFKDNKEKAIIGTITSYRALAPNSRASFYVSDPPMENVPTSNIAILGFQWRIAIDKWAMGESRNGLPFIEIMKNPDGSGKNVFRLMLENPDSTNTYNVHYKITYMVSNGN